MSTSIIKEKDILHPVVKGNITIDLPSTFVVSISLLIPTIDRVLRARPSSLTLTYIGHSERDEALFEVNTIG